MMLGEVTFSSVKLSSLLYLLLKELPLLLLLDWNLLFLKKGLMLILTTLFFGKRLLHLTPILFSLERSQGFDLDFSVILSHRVDLVEEVMSFFSRLKGLKILRLLGHSWVVLRLLLFLSRLVCQDCLLLHTRSRRQIFMNETSYNRVIQVLIGYKCPSLTTLN